MWQLLTLVILGCSFPPLHRIFLQKPLSKDKNLGLQAELCSNSRFSPPHSPFITVSSESYKKYSEWGKDGGTPLLSPPHTSLHPLLRKNIALMCIPRHFQSRQPLPASCVRSSTNQYRNYREVSPQVQTGAVKKLQMKWWELKSSYFNLKLLIIKHDPWIFMDYNLTWDLQNI